MFVTVNDINVYYEQYGSGQPVLLLHGNCGSSHSFRFVIEQLQKDFCLYAIDTRWHGKTKRGKGTSAQNASYPQFALDLIGFVEALGLTKPHIIGYSDGGITALAYAGMCPDNVGRVITLGANFTTDGVDEGFKKYCKRLLATHYLFRFLPPVGRKYWLHRLMLYGAYPDVQLLDQIATPVLLMAGDRDIIPRPHTDWLKSKIPTAKLAIIEDCGHSIMKEKTEAFLHTAKQFLMQG